MLSEEIKQQIQKVYGQEIKYPRDCEGLAACISERTGNSISSSTLKRLFGFVKTSSKPSQFTLDTVALYIGYQDWSSFEKSKQENGDIQKVVEVEKSSPTVKRNLRKKNYLFVLMAGILLAAITVWFILWSSTKAENWTELAPLPEVRSGGRMVSYENSIFYIGGADAEFMRDNIWQYNVKSDKWNVLRSMPTARAEFACSRVDNKIYCFGGYLGAKEGASNKVEVYDIAMNNWQELPEMEKPLISGRAVSSGTDIYIIGGSFGETKNIFLKYNTQTESYTELSIFKTQRNHYTMSIFDEQIFVIGGMAFHNGEYIWYNNVDIYDIKTGNWSIGKEIPINLARAAEITVGKEIHVIGGSDKFGNALEGLLDTYFIYNTENDSWTEKEKLSFKIRSEEGISLEDRLFLFGGSTDFPNPSNKVFTRMVFQ